uniref:hypothetical protein n=1 Tax=Escherichia coli TaxID=562 RepID=UPI003326D67E
MKLPDILPGSHNALVRLQQDTIVCLCRLTVRAYDIAQTDEFPLFLRYFRLHCTENSVTVSFKPSFASFPVSDTNVHFRSKGTFKMNARKAVLADNPELILRVLQLRFDESLSYPRISAQTGISKTAIFLW